MLKCKFFKFTPFRYFFLLKPPRGEILRRAPLSANIRAHSWYVTGLKKLTVANNRSSRAAPMRGGIIAVPVCFLKNVKTIRKRIFVHTLSNRLKPSFSSRGTPLLLLLLLLLGRYNFILDAARTDLPTVTSGSHGRKADSSIKMRCAPRRCPLRSSWTSTPLAVLFHCTQLSAVRNAYVYAVTVL